MKSIALIFILFSAPAGAQSLNLNELISFVNSEPSTINDNLSKKGWSFFGSHVDSYSSVANDFSKSATWAYRPNEYDSTALGWLTALTHYGKGNKVTYQTHSIRTYNTLIQSIKSLNAEKVTSHIGNEYISTLYYGNKYAYLVMSRASKYIIDVYNKVDYVKNEIVQIDEIATDTSTRPLEHLYTASLKKEFKTAPLRENADINSTVVYEIKTEDEIYVFKRGDIYHYVNVRGHWGYVSRAFLSEL